MYMSHNFS